jgi:hypothetical protein
MTITTNQNPRPVTVRVAVIFLLISMAIVIITIAGRTHWSDPRAYVGFMLIVGVPLLFVWLIYQGKNWARWVFLVMFALGLLFSLRSFHLPKAHTTVTLVLFCIHSVLQLVAAIALLLRPSNDWFRGHTNAA